MNRSPISRWRWAVWATIAIHFAAFLLLGLSRHWGYLTSVNDLGVFDQAVWGTLNGELLRNTSQLNQPINWLGFHFHPVLLLFVPLYAISPSAEWFVLAQAAALSFSAWPIFLLASRVCQSEKAGMLWALAYLVNPFLLSAAAWDFHPVALAVPFMALGMLAVEEGRRPLMLSACLPLLFIQEHFGLAVAGFGMLWALHNRDWRFGVALAGLGIAHAALVLGVVMPALSPSGGHIMLDSGYGLHSRYGWLGKSVGDVLATTLGDPLRVARIVIFNLGGLLYIFLLLAPLLFLPLAAIAFLLPGLADLAANMLSLTPMSRSLFSYHSVSLLPALTAAAIFGARRLAVMTKRFSLPEIAGLALAASLIMGYRFAPFPLPGASNLWEPKSWVAHPEGFVHILQKTVGEGSLSVQTNVGAHFSQRSDVYAYPNKLGETDAIVLRLESPTRKLHPDDPAAIASLTSHLQMRPAEYLASIECSLLGGNYGVALWRDPWLVLSRDTMKNPTLQREIELKLLRLQQEWEISADEYVTALKTCKK